MKKAMRKKVVTAAYKKISHADRIKIIYQNTVHQIAVSDISREMGIKYNSIRNILRAYEQSGRTNKKKYFRNVPKEDPRSSAEATPQKDTALDWSSNEHSGAFGERPCFRNSEPSLCETADLSPTDRSPNYPTQDRSPAPLRLPKISIDLGEQSQATKPASSQRCGLKLYLCQGPATVADDTNDENQIKYETNPHDKPEDYERPFVFNHSDKGYPYKGQVFEQDLDHAENVGLDIVTYENGKKLTQFFTGDLSLFNKYISKHQQTSALQGCSELEKKLALKLLKTLPQDKSTVLKLMSQPRHAKR